MKYSITIKSKDDVMKLNEAATKEQSDIQQGDQDCSPDAPGAVDQSGQEQYQVKQRQPLQTDRDDAVEADLHHWIKNGNCQHQRQIEVIAGGIAGQETGDDAACDTGEIEQVESQRPPLTLQDAAGEMEEHQ